MSEQALRIIADSDRGCRPYVTTLREQMSSAGKPGDWALPCSSWLMYSYLTPDASLKSFSDIRLRVRHAFNARPYFDSVMGQKFLRKWIDIPVKIAYSLSEIYLTR